MEDEYEVHHHGLSLEYPIKVLFAPGMETVLYGKPGAKVFMDEFGIEWISFIARNGPGAGKENMIRTDDLIIVRDDK